MMVVQEFGELLSQTFIALALVAKNDGAFEKQMLQLLRQIAPEVRRGGPEHEKVAAEVGVGAGRT